MEKIYKCGNVKFCMENKNQRGTWEHLQKMTRKDGSYGKIFSDAFVVVLDSKNELRTDKSIESFISSLKQEAERLEELLERIMESKF